MTLFSRKNGFTREGKEVLSYLNRRRGKAVSQGDIAHGLGISRKTVSRAVSDLEAVGLIDVDRTTVPHTYRKGEAA